MKDYYQRSIKALQPAGLSERTQQCYTRAVRMVVEYHDKTPDKISEPELQDYSESFTPGAAPWNIIPTSITWQPVGRFPPKIKNGAHPGLISICR